MPCTMSRCPSAVPGRLVVSANNLDREVTGHRKFEYRQGSFGDSSTLRPGTSCSHNLGCKWTQNIAIRCQRRAMKNDARFDKRSACVAACGCLSHDFAKTLQECRAICAGSHNTQPSQMFHPPVLEISVRLNFQSHGLLCFLQRSTTTVSQFKYRSCKLLLAKKVCQTRCKSALWSNFVWKDCASDPFTLGRPHRSIW